MRAVVISENMGPPLDEGIRKFATMLMRGLGAWSEAAGICAGSGPSSASDAGTRVQDAPGGKLFRGKALQDAVRSARPDLVVYVPSASGTLFSFMRARALKRAAPGARILMVMTQRREHTAPVRRLLRWLAPDSVLCQSPATIAYFRSLGIEAGFIPSGVDLDVFRPVQVAEKIALRRKHGLPEGEFLVLHAGHLKRERNVELLAKLNGAGRGVVLASASMGFEKAAADVLRSTGVVVIDRYVEAAQELYQAADCYLFPVREADSAMEFPLSVLEAMACNLAVVSFPYGGLPLALEARDGLVFAESDGELLAGVRSARGMSPNTRAQAEGFSWERIGQLLLEAAGERDAGTIAAAV